MNFMGYRRKNGQVGSRNYVAIIPTVFCANEIAAAIERQTNITKALLHHKGCCQLPPDLESTTDSLIRLGENPNVGGVLLVSLGCEGADVDRIERELKEYGKPVERVNIQELGGTSAAISKGIDCAQRLELEIAGQNREKVDLSNLVVGIKCGGSDTTSGLASNPVIGYVADKIIENKGTVIFGETTEFIGAEHVLARRAKNKNVADKIYNIVNKMELLAKNRGVDMRKGQPTPGNIEGGLSSIEEKSLGAIVKSGSKTIEDVLGYNDKPHTKGLFIKDTPGKELEVLTAMAIAGAQVILFSTGRGSPQGFPIVPVIKICGNPRTYNKMCNDMDINAGKIITNEKSIHEVGEETFEKLIKILSGDETKSESINYTATMDIYTEGSSI